MQDGISPHVCKINIKEADVTGKWRIRNTAVFVGVFPRPVTRAILSFLNLAIDHLGVDKGDIPLVFFNVLIQEFKNTICTRYSHNDGVNLP